MCRGAVHLYGRVTFSTELGPHHDEARGERLGFTGWVAMDDRIRYNESRVDSESHGRWKGGVRVWR